MKEAEMMSWYWGMGAWGMGAMVFAWMAFFALTAWLISRVTRTEHATTTSESARSVLDRRFAAGEVSAEQYASMRRALDGAPHPS